MAAIILEAGDRTEKTIVSDLKGLCLLHPERERDKEVKNSNMCHEEYERSKYKWFRGGLGGAKLIWRVSGIN